MIKTRKLFPVLATLAAIVAITGCSSSSSGGDSSSSDLAGFASPGSLVFVEGKLQPTGAQKANIDWAANELAGVEDLGKFIVSELEKSARQNGESFDFSKEVEPWLGERGSVAFERLKGGELSEPLIAIETTDPKATEAFVDKRSKKSNNASKGGSYKGVDFKLGGPGENAVGVIDKALVIADSEREFKAAVDAAAGDSLGDEDRFQKAISAASNASFADIYVDVGGIIEQSKDRIDPQAQEILQSIGIDPSEATAVASVIPQPSHIEIDLSSDIAGATQPSADVSKLLGTVPGDPFVAFAFSDFGGQLEKAIDNLDESGIPPGLPPHQLKSTLSQAGIDLDKIAASFEDGAIFVDGSLGDLGGALVLKTDGSDEATSAIASLGTLLRSARVPGVTAIGGKASGFSVKSPEFDKPIVIATKGDRVVIAYGLPAALEGLDPGSQTSTLAENPNFQAVISLLGKTPVVAYANGPSVRYLAEKLVPRSEKDFWKVVPYLNLTHIGVGVGTDGDLATAKVVTGLGF